jgi:hypothetical protein
MPFRICLWTEKTIRYVAEHDVTPEEFAEAVNAPEWEGRSNSSGRTACKGYVNGRLLFCIFDVVDEVHIIPHNAYEIED